MTAAPQPRPGSDEALKAGCLCPPLDNAHGRGWMGIEGQYVIAGDCPMHAQKEAEGGRE